MTRRRPPQVKARSRPATRTTTARDPESVKASEAGPLPHPVPDVMTVQQVAKYLGLAVITVYKKVQAHEIPFTKVGNLLRFTRSSIDQWLARNTVTPDEDLFQQFALLQNRYHFRLWLEGRGVDWRKVTDAQVADLAAKAVADLRATAATES